MKKILPKNKGQTIVEVSLILPLLMILVGAAVDWGLAFFVSHVAQNAAREAVRAGATQTTTSTISATAKAQAQAVIPDTPLFSSFRNSGNIIVTGPSGTCPNQEVTVQISGPFNFYFLRLFNFVSVTITRSSTMRWERQPVDCS